MSFNNKAVITLQVGHYANYVGTHFWNAQELSFQVAKEKNDLDHDVFYREGFLNSGNTKHVTYTPRLVSVDLKGALGKKNVIWKHFDSLNTDEHTYATFGLMTLLLHTYLLTVTDFLIKFGITPHMHLQGIS